MAARASRPEAAAAISQLLTKRQRGCSLAKAASSLAMVWRRRSGTDLARKQSREGRRPYQASRSSPGFGFGRVDGRPRRRGVRRGRSCPLAAVAAGADHSGMVAACMKRRSPRIDRGGRCFTKKSRCPRWPRARSPKSSGAATGLATKTASARPEEGSCVLPCATEPADATGTLDASRCRTSRGGRSACTGRARRRKQPSGQARVDQPPYRPPTQSPWHLI